MKIRDSLLSYMDFITILGSIATIIMPTSCFVEDVLINIHTMWLHCGSLVVLIYLLMNKEILLNILVYNMNILNTDTFKRFYISPYFISPLLVFDIIQKNKNLFYFSVEKNT